MKLAITTILVLIALVVFPASVALYGPPASAATQPTASAVSPLATSALIADLLKILLATAAFVVAVFTLFARDSRLRAHGENILVALIIFILSTMVLFGAYISSIFSQDLIARTATALSLGLYACAFLGMFFSVLLKSYNQMYNLRTDKLFRYFKPIRILRHVIRRKTYEHSPKPHNTTSSTFLGPLEPFLTATDRTNLINGGVLLLKGSSRQALISCALSAVADRLAADETVNYVCADRHPNEVWAALKPLSPNLENRASDLVFVDSYCPAFAFTDDIQYDITGKLKEWGVATLPARSFAGIHTAVAGSFNLIQAREKKLGKGVRRPGTMVYAFTSTLCALEGVEQYEIFWKHVAPSEHSYQMITLILEDSFVDPAVSRVVEQASDIVFVVKQDPNGSITLNRER